MENWRYYNHAMIPNTPPHMDADVGEIADKEFWSQGGHPLFARWVANFDCGYETDWWYCIKDTPFSFDQTSSNRRTHIRKALKIVEVSIIDPTEYIEKIFEIEQLCNEEYPVQYRPNVSFQKTKKECTDWKNQSCLVFGAFSRESGDMLGYACTVPHGDYVSLAIQKVPGKYLPMGTNAAIVYAVCEELLNMGKYQFKYINDGARNMVHQTNFQEYLVKYFGFRYAYCDLRIKYAPGIAPLVMIAYPFRALIYRLSDIKVFYLSGSVLKMEKIKRKCAQQKKMRE